MGYLLASPYHTGLGLGTCVLSSVPASEEFHFLKQPLCGTRSPFTPAAPRFNSQFCSWMSRRSSTTAGGDSLCSGRHHCLCQTRTDCIPAGLSPDSLRSMGLLSPLSPMSRHDPCCSVVGPAAGGGALQPPVLLQEGLAIPESVLSWCAAHVADGNRNGAQRNDLNCFLSSSW